MKRELDLSELLGKTMLSVSLEHGDENGEQYENEIGNEIVFNCTDGTRYKLYHDQDCCEAVYVEDVVGDLSDLAGSPILMAEEVSSDYKPYPQDSREQFCQWTFYKFATIKGYVDVRWLGQSDCYSVAVKFAQID